METTMMNIDYRKIEFHDANKINEIDASTYIKNAWRDVSGKKQLVAINYHEDGYPNDINEHIDALKSTIINQGFALGAYLDNIMIGFVTLNKEIFGKTAKYVLLDQLFVSKPYRKLGIGKRLLKFSIDKAKAWSVDKIYICAGSSEDTIAFYNAMGCHMAKEINEDLSAEDPRDIQLEYVL